MSAIGAAVVSDNGRPWLACLESARPRSTGPAGISCATPRQEASYRAVVEGWCIGGTNQAGLAVAVVCRPDRGGDALVAYRLDDQADGRRWGDPNVEVLVDHRHATPRPGRGGRPSGQFAS